MPDALETERLLLRGFRMEDAPAHHAQVGSDPEVTWGRVAHTLEQTEQRIESYIRMWDERGYGPLAAVDRESGELLGHSGLQPLEESDLIQLGYYFGRSAWGRGLATEAGARVVRFGFEDLGLERILAVVRHFNEPSQRVLAKLGFTYERDGHWHGQDAQMWVLEQAAQADRG